MDEPPPEDLPPPPAVDDLRALLESARGGDPEALPALRAALDAHPEIWRAYGDLAAHAERSWIGLIAGPDLVLAESLGRKVGALKDELAGPTPAPLERLLVERITTSWLQVHFADAAAAQARDVSIRQADLALKRQARAHRNYLTAIGALATVRRLLPAAAGPPVSAPLPCDAEDGPGTRPARQPLDPRRRPPGSEDCGRDGGRSVPLALFDRPPASSGHEGPDRPRGRHKRPAS